ncbi:MAG: hypothetical protein PHS41_10670 [Victivallaceae bacterium]|nr:hypothetical protein [Victivallaceae bacterium]
MKRVKFFNMVEMALALAVVAVGMTAILGVVPVALKSYRAATVDNNIALAAELVKSYLDAKYAAASTLAAFRSEFYPDQPNKPRVPVPPEVLPTPAPGTEGFDLATATFTKLSPGVFRLELKPNSTDVDADFLVIIWVEGMENLPLAGETYGKSKDAPYKISENFAFTVYVEIGYPANASDERETRVFVYDYFRK